jgi:hypothetical protein
MDVAAEHASFCALAAVQAKMALAAIARLLRAIRDNWIWIMMCIPVKGR